MRLATWLERNGVSDAEFGQKIGAHRTRVWAWKRGVGSPQAKHLAAISEVTKGKVTAKDFSQAA